jgi:transcriptional regulator with XRE-family HTH domain
MIEQRLKEVMSEKGISSAELARKAGMKKQSIYKYERGLIKNVPYASVFRISEVLNVNPSYLVGWSNDKIRPVDLVNYFGGSVDE